MLIVFYMCTQLQILEMYMYIDTKVYGMYLCQNTGRNKNNTLRPRQNVRHFADDVFKCILLNENFAVANNILLKCIPWGLGCIIPSLFLIMAWRRPGDKSLSVPIMVMLPTQICVTWPQWDNWKCFTHHWSYWRDSAMMWLVWLTCNISVFPKDI